MFLHFILLCENISLLMKTLLNDAFLMDLCLLYCDFSVLTSFGLRIGGSEFVAVRRNMLYHHAAGAFC